MRTDPQRPPHAGCPRGDPGPQVVLRLCCAPSPRRSPKGRRRGSPLYATLGSHICRTLGVASGALGELPYYLDSSRPKCREALRARLIYYCRDPLLNPLRAKKPKIKCLRRLSLGEIKVNDKSAGYIRRLRRLRRELLDGTQELSILTGQEGCIDTLLTCDSAELIRFKQQS
jgi:hypothetical protein